MALLTPDSVDVLSHSAVRARNGGVVMAACFDAGALAAVEQLSGRRVDVTVLQACPSRAPFIIRVLGFKGIKASLVPEHRGG